MNKSFVKNQKKFGQDGFAAIIVTLVVITIVILLVLGFTAIVSRESRSSIDQQLSTQAFYAAETGVNDIAQLVADDDVEVGRIRTCDEFISNSDLSENRLLSEDVEYTCVLVDTAPDSLAISSVRTDKPTVLRIRAVDEATGDPVNIATLTVHWQAEDVPSEIEFPTDSDDFPAEWDYAAPVLRVALTNLARSEGISRQSLIEHTYTSFLRPVRSGGGGTIDITSEADMSQQGRIERSLCTDLPDSGSDEYRFCSKTLEFDDSVDQTNASEGFLLVLRSIYTNADVFITGVDTDGRPVRFADQQIVIDSTGRANDVLRRVQARLPANNQFDIPGSPVETTKLGGLCKRFTVDDDDGGGANQCSSVFQY